MTLALPLTPSLDTGAVTQQTQTSWRFIDRQTYSALNENRHVSVVGDFTDIWHKDTKAAKQLSESSFEYITMIDKILKQVLLGQSAFDLGDGTFNSTYLLAQAKAYLNDASEENTSFYEIQLIDNQNFMVVVGRGFLHHVTQSKDNLLAYVLACLRCLDHFNCSYLQLNTLYLRLAYVKDYTVLIKNKAQF